MAVVNMLHSKRGSTYKTLLKKKITEADIHRIALSNALLGNTDSALRTIQIQRLPKLFEHFDIQPTHSLNSYLKLILALAERHIPGFQQDHRSKRNKRGRPRGEVREYFEIVSEVQKLRKNKPSLSVSAACFNLTRRKSKFSGQNPNTLRRKFNEVKLTMRKNETINFQRNQCWKLPKNI